MEFICEIATQLTELNYHEDTFQTIQDGLSDETCIVFKEEAQDFFNERYDEVETMANSMMNLYSDNDKPTNK
jgi:hypothetical protein